MKVPAPVSRHTPFGTRYGLGGRVMCRRSQRGAVGVLVGRVVPEPLLARLEALHQGMVTGLRVLARVLRRGRIAAPDMPTLCAATEMQPPSIRGQALDAPSAARRNTRVDGSGIGHLPATFPIRVARSLRLPEGENVRLGAGFEERDLRRPRADRVVRAQDWERRPSTSTPFPSSPTSTPCDAPATAAWSLSSSYPGVPGGWTSATISLIRTQGGHHEQHRHPQRRER
jgi:hypothetical protein